MENVSIYRESALEPEHVLEFGARHVAIATGSTWRSDGIGRNSGFAVPGFDGANVYSPDDLMSGRVPSAGPVIIWDDDHYYMGGLLAERCRAAGLDVTLVTPAATLSAWTVNTLEAVPIAKRIARLGIEVVTYTSVAGFDGSKARLISALTGAESELPCAALVTVTARLPVDALYLGLDQMSDRWGSAGIASITRIGDCWAPSTIQQAVYTGHKWARGLDEGVRRAHSARVADDRVGSGESGPVKTALALLRGGARVAGGCSGTRSREFRSKVSRAPSTRSPISVGSKSVRRR